MATSDKLNYILETKDAIKTSIQNKGVEVQDTDTFRSYAEKIDEISTKIETESIEIIPTKDVQTINRSEDKYIESVKVYAIPDEYIIPSGNLEITENGNYNVVDKESVDVNVQSILGTKTITENGIYNAIDDNLDGYSSVEVETSGVDINQYMTNVPTKISNFSGVGGWMTCIKKLQPLEISGETNLRYLYAYFLGEEIDVSKINTVGVTNMSYMFARLENVTSHLDLSHFDTSLVTTMEGMFCYIGKLESVGPSEEYDINIENFYTPKLTSIYQMFANSTNFKKIDISHFDTSNVTSMGVLYDSDSNLTDINMSNCDFGKVASVNYMYRGCAKLVNLRIGKNVGKGYNPNNSANYYSNTIDLSSSNNLTYESLMDVFNNIYDIASIGCNTQRLIIGTTNMAKLEATEEGQQAIDNATLKGWAVS